MERIIQPGLRRTPIDHRDFSYKAVFGAPSILDIPLNDWLDGHIQVKDQGNTDFCTGYATSAVSEDQEGVTLDPAFAFAMGKREQGNWQSWGGDIRCALKGHVDYGCIEVGQNPMDFGNKPRDFIANWNNWPLQTLAVLASNHRKASFFKIDGNYDTFDNIRAALWANRADKRSIVTGVMWRPGWLHAPRGIIPAKAVSGGVGHCIKIANGQKIIDGEPYLIHQGSAGIDVGDNGLYYLSREVVNREFVFGAYMFKDMDPQVVRQTLTTQGALINNRINNPLTALAEWVRQLITIHL